MRPGIPETWSRARKFRVQAGASREWWLWHPELQDWSFCGTFENAIARMDAAISVLRGHV